MIFEELLQQLKAGRRVTIGRGRPQARGHAVSVAAAKQPKNPTYVAEWWTKEGTIGVTWEQAQQLIEEGAIDEEELRPTS